MKTITETIGGAQALLDIPFDIQKCFEEKLNNEQKTFLHMLRIVTEYLPPLERSYRGTGRKPYPYLPFVKSELAKRYFQIDTTTKLIERLKADPNLRLLCGFERVPGEASFSRSFKYLCGTGILGDAIDRLAEAAFRNRFACHIIRDSTAIPAREKVEKKKKEGKKTEKGAAKTEKGACKREKADKKAGKREKEPGEMEKQILRDAGESLALIDTRCAWGCKKNSQGNVSFWKGYKLHLDVTDGGFPVTACVSGANVHDSRLAVPMEKLTEKKLQYFYSLMDSAYDAKTLVSYIESRDRVPVIEVNKRSSNSRVPLDPAKRERYKIRTTVERANSHLKDWLLPKALYVKGFVKVSFVLFSAVLCLSALKYLQLFT